jgi:ribonuclease P protein component
VPTPLFTAIRNQGKTFHSPHLSLRVVDSEAKDPSRVAFVVSVKVAKTAVARNKLKRQARYIVNKHHISQSRGKITIVYFKPGASKASFSSLESELTLLLKQAHVI